MVIGSRRLVPALEGIDTVSSSHWTAAIAVAVALLAGGLDSSGIVPRVASSSEIVHGELLARTGTNQTPFLFVGAAGVTAEGGTLYRMGARFYDAGLRRFLSPDPLGIDGGFNLYAYADADPVNRVDPLGLCAQSGWGAPSVDANGFGTRSLSPSELSRVMSRMGLREEIHPLAMQTAISTAFKAAGTVALFAVPGPEDLVAGAVMAGLARTGGRALLMRTSAAKIVTSNLGDALDPLIARRMGSIISDNPMASAAYRQLQRRGIPVTLDFGVAPRGLQGLGGSHGATVFMRNHSSAQEAVSTFVHESRHAIGASRGANQNTQWAEFMARGREFLYMYARRPTAVERLRIWQDILAHEEYRALPFR